MDTNCWGASTVASEMRDFESLRSLHCSVVIWKNGEVVGHVLKSLSKVTSFFSYDGNVAFCEVTG